MSLLLELRACYWCPICSIALFGSEEKAKLFVPNAEEKKCITISSNTGTLADIDLETVKNSMQIFDMALALA